MGSSAKMSKADWDAVVSTNLDSMFSVTKQVIEGMVEASLCVSSTFRRSMAGLVVGELFHQSQLAWLHHSTGRK
jgi:NADP-dependent 3-hydroxy acid dehydrogenase YdfG